MSEVKRFDAFTSFDDFKSRMVESKDGNYVAYSDYLSQLQQTDAMQTSPNNIINAFGISGEGAHRKLLIEYVHGLVAENAALKAAFNPVEIPEDAVDALGDTAEFDWDSNESGSWTWVENDTDVIRAVLDAMPKPETPLTDAFTAELRAQGVDDFLNDEFVQEVAMRLADFNGETEESVSTVVWSGMPPEPEGNVWELEYVRRASFLSRKLKEFAANLRAGRKG